MVMETLFRQYITENRELNVPVKRRDFPETEFSNLFKVSFEWENDLVPAALGRVYLRHVGDIERYMEQVPLDDVDAARFDDTVRIEIVERIMTRLAREQGMTIFRLLSGATPEQEAAFNFFESGLNASFWDFMWAVEYGNVQPEELAALGRPKIPLLRGILRASQGRANRETGVTILHVAHVLSFSRLSRNPVKGTTPAWSSYIKEMSEGVAEGSLDDNAMRMLATSKLGSQDFFSVLGMLREGVSPEYAFEYAGAGA